ncbi:unnamed protein product [Candidula unifasciata]|uniref:Hexosyltransferase n=1 Tax=Candidula unifasciata TaxID=100452 RepID=A0A8S3ZJ70_9EUPU|nr:unnamed protein product [Candidula unifasciata]
MVLATQSKPIRKHARNLCFLITCAIGINVLWNNVSYRYISARIVAMSTFKVSRRDFRPLGTTLPSVLRSKHSSKPTQFRIQQIADEGNVSNVYPELLRTPIKRIMTRYNHSKLEQQKVYQKSNKTKLEQQKIYQKSNNSKIEEQKVCRNETSPQCQEFKRRRRSEMYDEILEYYRIRENETKDSFVNLHRYGYHLDSNACSRRPDVVILVHSKFDHFGKRKQIRNTYAANRTVQGINFATVFFLGEPSIQEMKPDIWRSKRTKQEETERQEGLPGNLDEIRKEIYTESATFGDIVMGNFTDSYRNLTIKHIMALNWALSHCPHVVYIAKADDDVIVNPFSLAKYLTGTHCNRSGLLTCIVPKLRAPMRSKRMKWFLSKTEYPFTLYPVWCLGLGELMTRDVAETLLKMSRDVRTFWIDDVYVTGFLRHKAGLSLIDMTRITGKDPTFFTLPDYLRNQTFLAKWKQMITK